MVGEASGDCLGAALIEQLRLLFPALSFEGVLGPRLTALGGKQLYDAERLAVMGFVEPLKRLPELLRMRRTLCQYFRHNPPDVFIGIDAPDFTLSIEKYLKRQQIKTVHYVSPSVWAWRPGRIKTIKKAVDLMLVLFPFEEQWYQQQAVPVVYVGHPLAHQIPLAMAPKPEKPKTVAILPGSRHSEICSMAALFLKTAQQLQHHFPELHFIAPMASPAIHVSFLAIKNAIAPNLNLELRAGQADAVLAQSDCALITSGTATLQAMLHHCPMVVAYKTGALNAWLIRRFYRQPWFALPNILARKRIVAEYFQAEATQETLFNDMCMLLQDKVRVRSMQAEFLSLHQGLQQPVQDTGARAIAAMLQPQPLDAA